MPETLTDVRATDYQQEIWQSAIDLLDTNVVDPHVVEVNYPYHVRQKLGTTGLRLARSWNYNDGLKTSHLLVEETRVASRDFYVYQ